MMNIGDFRYIFKVHREIEGKDRLGQPLKSIDYLLSFYGSRLNWQNRQQYEGKQLIESDIIVVNTFYNSDINVFDFLEDESGDIYKIKGVKEIGYKEFIQITAQYKSNK